MTNAKPTVPEVQPLVWALYKRSAVGCCWHVVLDDRNIEDGIVDATARGILDGTRGCGGGEECMRLALLLPRMSRTQRRKLACGKVEPWRSPADAHRIGGGFRSPCRACGFVRKRLPSWAKHGALFGLRGRVYRIVTLSSSNKGTPYNMHMREYVRAAPITEEAPTLPDVPCTKAAFGAALVEIFALPEFSVEDLEAAIHIPDETR